MRESRVHILPSHLADKIAAGEVVERPASVVKELVENAIDAHAMSIIVDVQNGGMDSITVLDDGCGIVAEDLPLAVQRHATSKIRDESDLFTIHTLGFRGEALPSIASVSRFYIESRSKDAEVGSFLEIEGGAVVTSGIHGGPHGTKIIVNDLFFNVPARKKFLKVQRTELSHIQDCIVRLALANPSIRFQLRHNEKTLLQCSGSIELSQRAYEVLGRPSAGSFVPLLEESGEVAVSGLLGTPEMARAGGGFYLYVNNRPVRDRLMVHAVTEAYRSLIPIGTQPVVLLFLTIQPDLVDVNVHPTKAEVRFVKTQAVHHFIVTALRKVTASWTGLSLACVPSSHSSTQHHHDAKPSSEPTEKNRMPSPHPLSSSSSSFSSLASVAQYTFEASEEMIRHLGQVGLTYLLYESPKGTLIVIDQHAAHERIGFEAFKKQLKSGGVQSQQLLVPEVVDLTPKEMSALMERSELLSRLGLEIGEFGQGSIVITALPSLLGNGSVKELVTQLAHDLLEEAGAVALEEKLDHIMATMACHRQVRAGQPISDQEAMALIREMSEQAVPVRCPHGRPTWIEITQAEMAKWFKRT